MFKPLLILLFISWVNIAQAAEMVVIRSNATNLFPKGQLLENNISFNLPAQAEVTVAFASGGIQTVVGPYQGFFTDPLPKNKADPDLVKQLAAFVTQTETFRTTATSQQPNSVWMVDVSTTKRFYCVAASDRVRLWRPGSQSKNASTLKIKHKSTGKEVQVVWPARQKTLKWPSHLPIVYGDTYTVELKTRSSSSFKKLVLYQLPESLPTESHKVVWMVGRGCIPQANMLLASLR